MEERRGPRGELLREAHEGLPDSHFLSGLCPRCGKQTSFESRGSIMVTHDGQEAYDSDGRRSYTTLDQVAVLFCRHCDQGTAVVEKIVREDLQPGQREMMRKVYFQGVHWWSLPEANLAPDIPQDIAGAFAEATSALYAQCPRAAVVMARRTLEAVTADKGETQGVLAVRLQSNN